MIFSLEGFTSVKNRILIRTVFFVLFCGLDFERSRRTQKPYLVSLERGDSHLSRSVEIARIGHVTRRGHGDPVEAVCFGEVGLRTRTWRSRRSPLTADEPEGGGRPFELGASLVRSFPSSYTGLWNPGQEKWVRVRFRNYPSSCYLSLEIDCDLQTQKRGPFPFPDRERSLASWWKSLALIAQWTGELSQYGLYSSVTVFLGTLEQLGREEQRRTWWMDSAQPHKLRMKKEVSSTHLLDRPRSNSIELQSQWSNPKNVASLLTPL
ncbi:unnamed protein product [Microthlaspi erraticum]|uniref:Uncharacterized protein n=1 Tax=Microthlaspi erraticum TaxID=1685480 RepID=A0A6D2I0F2_9BRAS|nr:unnamed protein product [Microthlaspi erraticum]